MRFRAKPYRVDDALTLEREAGLTRPVAVTLARRGIASEAEAIDFLEGGESYDPAEFRQMAEVAGRIAEAIRKERRITIYGDFDCDGVCATTILVSVIRELGGTCDWFIPDRISEGYGLNPEAIRKIVDRGTELIITVDCGVTAVEEVTLAQELGAEIIVTDHHQFGEVLPDCLILHPELSGYPFESLCGAAVAAKLATFLRRKGGLGNEGDEADLDLVALATVADVMPLVGENRHLVREGVKVARRGRRVGMAALMAEAKVEPSRLSSEDFGFRLGPRVNAAGRMYRADAGVELFLAQDESRAAEIARELSGANAERRRVEREVEAAARKELAALDDPGAAIVVVGEGWHPGVVGIVASRLARSEGRPAVVIALEGDEGRGSGRSVPGLDLHAALGDTAGLLQSFGGHAAAAGMSIEASKISEFREALSEAVIRRIGPDPVEPVVEFDAVVGGAEIGLSLAEEINKLQPFGAGNPGVKVLIPGARVEDLREMGEGRHCRFTVSSGGHLAKGVAFGRSDLGIEVGQRADLVAELNVNHWNGSVESQLNVVDVKAAPSTAPLAECSDAEWWCRFDAAMARSLPATPSASTPSLDLCGESAGLPGVTLAELISSGETLAVVTADARQRWEALGGEGLSRFLPGGDPEPEPELAEAEQVKGIWPGSPQGDAVKANQARVLLTDFASCSGPVGAILGDFERIVLLDPPHSHNAVVALAKTGRPVHLISGPDEFAFSARIATHRHDLTIQLRELFRAFREAEAIDGGEVTGDQLRQLLSVDGAGLRSPEQAADLLRVLLETGHARGGGEGSARTAGVVSSEKTKLTDSSVFVYYSELHKEQERFLSQFDRTTRKA